MTKEALMEKVLKCKQACDHCFDMCLQEEDANAMADCIRTDRECSEVCGMVLQLGNRDSVVFNEIVTACVKICKVCAEECEKHAEHHEHCKECAEACRECEAACETFLK